MEIGSLKTAFIVDALFKVNLHHIDLVQTVWRVKLISGYMFDPFSFSYVGTSHASVNWHSPK